MGLRMPPQNEKFSPSPARPARTQAGSNFSKVGPDVVESAATLMEFVAAPDGSPGGGTLRGCRRGFGHL
jgi:hypothetical protein